LHLVGYFHSDIFIVYVSFIIIRIYSLVGIMRSDFVLQAHISYD